MRAPKDGVPDVVGVKRFKRLVLAVPARPEEGFPEEVDRLMEALEAAGYVTTRAEVALAWERYSETMCAGWLRVTSYTRGEIVELLVGRQDPDDATGNGEQGPYLKVDGPARDPTIARARDDVVDAADGADGETP